MPSSTKNKESKVKRSSGILMHISSLPGEYGVGDFGSAAYQFADSLVQARQSIWQILPLTPTDTIYGNSPYSSNSAFAMNILFVSPELLLKDGWVTKEDVRVTAEFPRGRVDYPQVLAYKEKVMDAAYARVKDRLSGMKDFQQFCKDQVFWLDDYALFMALKGKFVNQSWTQWPQEIKARDESVLRGLFKEQQGPIQRIKFFQFVLYRQWAKLREYCQEKNVQILGDIPIYVNDDSADVWSHPEVFVLDENYCPAFVAGVPPDYFSQTGQRWGNPIYDWEILKETDYEWWMTRLRHNLSIYDLIRIDHFRAFVDFWQIPASEPTAVTGEWVQGPGDDFLNAIVKNFPKLPLVAEDLGILSPQVLEAMERFAFPGMKILLFAFGGELQANPYPPDKYTPNCVAYTGTHDNNTVYGWWENDASMHEKKNLALYLRRYKIKRKDPLHWLFIELLMNSAAGRVITPFQDVVGLGGEGRMNSPGTTHGNWEWRFTEKALPVEVVKKMRQLTEDTKRC